MLINPTLRAASSCARPARCRRLAGAGAPLALNLLACRQRGRAVGGRLPGAGVHLPVRRQRRLQHGAAHRQRRVDRPTRPLRNQAPDSIALLAPGTAANAGAAAGSPAAAGRRAADRATNAQGRTSRCTPCWAALQHDVQHRPAPGHRAQRRPAGAAHHQGAVRQRPRTRKPASLFSHNDQQNTWQALAPEGATVGWGGRMGDAAGGHEHQRTVFTVDLGHRQRGVAVRPDGAPVPGQQQRRHPHGGRRQRPHLRFGRGGKALQRIVSRHPRQPPDARPTWRRCRQRSIDAELALRTALRPPATPPSARAEQRQLQRQQRPQAAVRQPADRHHRAANPLAQQLQVVARMIDAGGQRRHRRTAPGVLRQPGRLRHPRPAEPQPGRPDGAAGARPGLLRHHAGRLGARNSVTAFTASDFGRTFTSNGDGTDHGWGATTS
jgi:hypothetical protein